MDSRLTRFETPLQAIELDGMGYFDRILDVGAGGEGLVAWLKGEDICGVDLRREEIQEIRGRGVRCSWVVCDARRLCFKDGAFDLVTLWFSDVRCEDRGQSSSSQTVRSSARAMASAVDKNRISADSKQNWQS